MNIRILMTLTLLLVGCAHENSALDKIKTSDCAKCNKKPFYVNGQWI